MRLYLKDKDKKGNKVFMEVDFFSFLICSFEVQFVAFLIVMAFFFVIGMIFG